MKHFILFFLMIVSSKIHSAITVTTVSPTNTFCNGTYAFDMNNDEINDFSIIRYLPGTIYLDCLNSGAMVQVTSGNAVPYAINNTIGTNTWISSTSIPMNLFYGQQHTRWLGLKVTVGGNTYYGWAAMYIPSGENCFTIYSFAYESTPNIPILANQDISTTGIFENSLTEKNFNVYPNPLKSNEALISDLLPGNNITVECIDITGKIIFAKQLIENRLLFSDVNLPKGIYFLKVYENTQFIGSKKIIIE